jgi:CheY-like chemotaxis protein
MIAGVRPASTVGMANDRPRVLLADPDPAHRREVTTVLALTGYHVLEVASGRMLLDAIARHRPDLADVPVVVVAGVFIDDADLARAQRALVRAGMPPVVSLPRGRVAARRLGPGAQSVIESGGSANELVHAVDYAFASMASTERASAA